MKKREDSQLSGSGLGRRDLMKLGAGVVMTTLAGEAAISKAAESTPAKPAGSAPLPRPAEATGGVDWKTVTSGPGYKNDANRLLGNGPMDDTSRKLIDYTLKFSEKNLTPNLIPGINLTVIDSMSALITGFESEIMRSTTRYARTMQGDMKSTVFGYGVVTSPEAATLANACAMRDADWVHSIDIIPACIAVGEALHKSGTEVLTAIALGLEVVSAFGRAEGAAAKAADEAGQPVRRQMFDNSKWDGPATALAVAKLMNLNEDRMANALSMSIVAQVPLNVSHVGALSNWKSAHGPWHVRSGVSGAIMASHGLTAPAQPFEERGGVFDVMTGPFTELKLPLVPGKLRAAEGLENGGYKRYPTDGDHQALLDVAVPAILAWTKAEDIASISIQVPFGHWQENADPPKWDPRNRETADHSMPYVVAYKLVYGDIFLEAFTPKMFVDNQQVREMMNRITITGAPDEGPNNEWGFHRSHLVVRKKSGEELVKDVYDMRAMSHDDVIAKYKRVCDFKGVSAEQRDRAMDAWGNLMKYSDIAEPIRTLAKFGKPTPL